MTVTLRQARDVLPIFFCYEPTLEVNPTLSGMAWKTILKSKPEHQIAPDISEKTILGNTLNTFRKL